MSSSVHFKFKSQKEPSRVTFDGTGISVFELKREIINQNRLGDGSDFELSVYNEDTGEEYDDDTSVIPRSTSVIARRLPATRPGKGGAARYVSGKMPVNARNSSRVEQSALNRVTVGTDQVINSSMLELNNAQTEDEKIKALMTLQANQWKEQQQEMANATPVASGRGRGKPVNVPDHPPPPGYLCYRCREKGHWIQACPTNNDPKFDGRYRVKRSTGIPRSLQTKVEKPDTLALEGPNEEPKNSGVMVNADGDFVIAQPDKAAWELFQEKIKASAAAAAEAAAAESSKELQVRGLECPIDRRLFLEPTKTPCCKRTYCNDCITNSLIESDFVCPGCSAEGVLLDNLSVDDTAVAKLKMYEAERAGEKKEKQQNGQAIAQNLKEDESIVTRSPQSKSVTSSPALPGRSAPIPPKKRLLEDDSAKKGLESKDIAPPMKRVRSQDQQKRNERPSSQVENTLGSFPPFPFSHQMPFGHLGFMQPQGVPAMSLAESGFSAGGGFMNPVMVPTVNGYPSSMNNGWNPISGIDYMPPQYNRIYNNGVNNSVSNAGFVVPNVYNGMVDTSLEMNGVGPMSSFPQQQHSSLQPGTTFSNQQRSTSYSAPLMREEDNAYFRQPVNPHRHQARQRRIRPSDYREL